MPRSAPDCSARWVALLCLVLYACSFIALLQELGVSHMAVSFVWLAGPISGLVVQPIVGTVSDIVTFKMGYDLAIAHHVVDPWR
jgi:hypothetical protein